MKELFDNLTIIKSQLPDNLKDDFNTVVNYFDSKKGFYLIDLKTKRVVMKSNKETIRKAWYQYENQEFNGGPQYICCTESELREGNFYLEPNEIKV